MKKTTNKFKLTCTLNGEPLEWETEASTRMITILRDELKLTGTKVSCEIGRCGACMILLDGEPVNACLLMAYQAHGKAVMTIEGLTSDACAGEPCSGTELRKLHPVQRAILEEGGFQCGYCTPGMVISMAGLLGANPEPSQDQLLEALSGNLCRCTGYGSILRAAEAAVRNCRSACADPGCHSEKDGRSRG